MVIYYRFSEFMPSGISVNRYARMSATVTTERIWIPALRRLMAEQGDTGWKQAELAEASGVRPNTIGDLLAGTNSRIDTFVDLAKAMKVPLWALFCTAEEYALFSAQTKKVEAAAVELNRQDEIRAAVQAELAPALAPVIEAIVAKLSGQSVQPVTVPAAPARPIATRVQKKAKGR